MNRIVQGFLIAIVLTTCYSCKDGKPNLKLKDEELESYGVDSRADNALGGLKVGYLAPDFKLMDDAGNEQSLSATLQLAPVVMTFYRGHWCGYCTRYLSALQDSLNAIKEHSHFIFLGISPEKIEYTKRMMYDNMLSLNFLHDKHHEVMKDYKVYFELNDAYQKKLESHTEVTVQDLTDNETAAMPIPASFVIGQDHRIKYVHYDPDYSQRANIDSLLAYFK